jgi:MraZ protein
VFKGTYRYRIDSKGRLPVPAAFRKALESSASSHLVVTVLDQCLAAYPPAEWERLEGQLSQLPAFKREVKALTRALASRAIDCALDGQGRILLPPGLRQACGLTREAAVIGVLNRFEIWAPEPWEAFLRDSDRILDDVSLDVHWPPPLGRPPSTGKP